LEKKGERHREGGGAGIREGSKLPAKLLRSLKGKRGKDNTRTYGSYDVSLLKKQERAEEKKKNLLLGNTERGLLRSPSRKKGGKGETYTDSRFSASGDKERGCSTRRKKAGNQNIELSSIIGEMGHEKK